MNAQMQFEKDLNTVLDEIKGLLIRKNRAYGDSALDPLRVFSKADPSEQIRIRLDDKLSRLARGDDAGEDTLQDILGYLVLLRIAVRRLAVDLISASQYLMSKPSQRRDILEPPLHMGMSS